MKFWIVQDGEPLPGIDGNCRPWRAAMLADVLQASGHEATWWASTFDHAHKVYRFPETTTVKVKSGVEIRMLHGPGYKRNKSLRRLWHYRVLAEQFRLQSMQARRPDLIFCSLPTLEFAQAAVAYGQRLGAPVVIDVRDPWPDIYLNYFPAALAPLARYLLYFEYRKLRRLLASATGITAVSQTYMEWALKHCGRAQGPNDLIVPLGFDFDEQRDQRAAAEVADQLRSELGLTPSTFVISFVGSFGDSYDLETVIEAAKLLDSQMPDLDVRIILAGSGDKMERLRKLSLGCKSLAIPGWLDQTKVRALLGLSTLGLAAYRKGAVQSLPNKPYEYMAAGLPLLSSLRGELNELISRERIGVNYESENPQSLVDAIVVLFNDAQLRKEFGENAKALFKDRFQAQAIYPKLAQFLEGIAGRFKVTNELDKVA